MQPFFSTIIPTHNRAELLGGALDSVLAQEYSDNEVIVIDDGSTDGTTELLARYQGRIRVFRQSQQGPGAARNLGIEHARGQYIAFLDSDDLWFPWTLAVFEQAIRRFDFPSFLTGTQTYFRQPEDLRPVTPGSFQCRRFRDFYATSRTFLEIGTGAVAVSSEALRNAGGFTERWINAEDSDLWMRLGTAPGFVRIVQPSLFGHRRHEHSAMADFRRTYEGCLFMILQETSGNYPGGAEREYERIEMLTRYIRPASFNCLCRGEAIAGWRIYRDCFRWHIRLRRIRYLLGYPMLVAASMVTRRSPRVGGPSRESDYLNEPCEPFEGSISPSSKTIACK